MMTALVVLTSILIALLLLVIVFVIRIARDLNKSLNEVSGKLVRLEKKLAEQQLEVDSLRKRVEDRPDVWSEIMGTIGQFRGQSPLNLIRSLTSKVFTAYFKQKRLKALPERVSSEVEK